MIIVTIEIKQLYFYVKQIQRRVAIVLDKIPLGASIFIILVDLAGRTIMLTPIISLF